MTSAGKEGWSRRRVLRAAGTGAAAAALAAARPGFASTWLPETPAQPLGPFYAPFKPLSIDNDLVLTPGSTTPAEGQVIHILGRVLDQLGRPIPDARVEIFQANTFGRYNHPRHANSRIKLDPNFQGFGHDASERDGSYRFRTIKPGPYADNPNWVRPPHIHFAVFPEKGSPWTTQMYFEGEELNRADLLLGGVPEKARPMLVRPMLSPLAGMGGESRRVEFDIVLGQPGVERQPT